MREDFAIPHRAVQRRIFAADIAGSALAALLRPLHAALRLPSLLFLATLAVMLFRPPDVQLYHLDRIALGLLVFVVLARTVVLRLPVPWTPSISLPLAGLLLLATLSALAQPFDPQTWSLLAAKFLVPFVLFHLAGIVFEDSRSAQQLEIFLLLALAYLSFTAIAWLAGATWLIFPKFILDESLGIHAGRARGPFLQAVANGVTLNLMGLVALNAIRHRRLRGLPMVALMSSLPVAVLATMTRAVWLSFGGAAAAVLAIRSQPRLKLGVAGLALVVVAGLLAAFAAGHFGTNVKDRMEDSGPVEMRAAIYGVSWELLVEKPLLGWGLNQMPAQVGRRIAGYHVEAFWAHNSYLEIAVEHGIAGLVLYGWTFLGLFRLGATRTGSAPSASPFNREFRKLWPVLLGVYLFNAFFVVMNYQFVNALLFTLAGVLAGQDRRVREGTV